MCAYAGHSVMTTVNIQGMVLQQILPNLQE